MTAPRFLHRLLCALGLHDKAFFHDDHHTPDLRWLKCNHCDRFFPVFRGGPRT
jgi:hypothetical protein